MTRRPRRQFGTIGKILVSLLGCFIFLTAGAGIASAQTNQGVVVPEEARRDLPVVLDGRVWAHAQVGDRIFVGGDFQQVELIDGTVIDQPYIFAYDIDTGVVDPNFRPVVNNVVRSLEAGDDGDTLYVGGRFFRWDDSFPSRIARLDGEGNLDTSFQASASAQILDIDQVGDSLYLVGNFTEFAGLAASGIAKVDAETGVVDASFLPVLDDFQNGSSLVRAIESTPDGSEIFILHYATIVDGQSREAVVKYDIDAAGTPTLSGWNIPWSAQAGGRICQSALRDMAISPDGSYIVIGGQGNDFPPNCDSVLRYQTAGDTTVNFEWSARLYSSVFSLAVSDVAVYVGGHFCAAPAVGAPPGGVTSDFPGLLPGCDVTDPSNPINPSNQDPNAVFRNQMAALSPVDGQALEWDPGSNNLVGVFDLTLIDRGLLAGHDSTRFNEFLVGRSGFFDLEPNTPDTENPTFVVTSPADGSVPETVTELTGTATDNQTVVEVIVRLRNTTTGQFLQVDGTFASASADLPVNLTNTGIGEVEWSVPVNTTLVPGEYEVRGFARDEFGNTTIPTVVSTFTIPGVTACTVELNDQDQPVITLMNFVADETGLSVIRRNESYLSDLGDDQTVFVDTTAIPGDYEYEVRWRPNGTVVDVPCSPSVTVPDDGPGAITTCIASIGPDNSPVLEWDLVDGVNNYIVREDNLGWIATVVGEDTFTDTGRAPGDYNYVLRIRIQGEITDIPCSPTITVPEGDTPVCTAAINAAGDVSLSWTSIPGVVVYQVRDNDGWVASETGTSFVDTNPTVGTRTYEIRYRLAGTVNDLICSPDVVVN